MRQWPCDYTDEWRWHTIKEFQDAGGECQQFRVRAVDLGYPHVSLYTGSWDEWSKHPELRTSIGQKP